LMIDQVIEFIRFKRSTSLINKRGDVVFDGFRDIFNLVFLSNPFNVSFSLL
jgi:hypothetical protein